MHRGLGGDFACRFLPVTRVLLPYSSFIDVSWTIRAMFDRNLRAIDWFITLGFLPTKMEFIGGDIRRTEEI